MRTLIRERERHPRGIVSDKNYANGEACPPGGLPGTFSSKKVSLLPSPQSLLIIPTPVDTDQTGA